MNQSIIDVVESLYDYVTKASHANWDNRRPGIVWDGPSDILTKSCGGFRIQP